MGTIAMSSRQRALCFARGGISAGTIAERQPGDATLASANVAGSAPLW